MLRTWPIGILLILAPTWPTWAITLHISPEGRDGWSGGLRTPNADRTDGPLASLAGARDAIRGLKEQGPLAEPVRVIIAGGDYTLRRPVVFEPRDSGTAACPISYEAAPGTKPVFSGGRRIRHWTRQPDGLLTARVSPDWKFEQLYINGHHAVRARTPNVVWHGMTPVPRYLYVTGRVRRWVDPATAETLDTSRRAFLADPADLRSLAEVPAEQWQDLNVVAYHAWETSRHRVRSLDRQTGQVILTGNAPWVFQWLNPNQRYHLENYRAALDAPGEWYLDPDGLLTYYPLPGEVVLEAVAPVADSFVQFQGESDPGPRVEHLTLQGLAFRHAHYLLPPQGHGDNQAAVTVPAAIMADGARNIQVRDCEISCVGTYGIWFRRRCTDCRVEGCHFHDLGAGGVKIGEAAFQSREGERTSHLTCDNNLIRAGGRLFSGAVGVWIGQSGDNQVTHNDISDLFYSGVSVGWSWNYRPTLAHRNQVEYNHIHHLGWGVMSDMGGVYTLGELEGSTVSHNVIHDIWSYDLYGWGGIGLYNDGATTHVTMENNLVYDTRDMTYHQHLGRENVVRNNLLLNGRDFQLSVHRPEPHLSATFENNIVYFRSGQLFWQNSLGERQLRCDRNVYWHAGGQPFTFMGLTFPDWQQRGLDPNSVIADPLFVDPNTLNFALRPESPALKLGFVPFDWRQAGLTAGNPLTPVARGLRYPPVQFAPEAPPRPPRPICDDFEDYAAGDRPEAQQINLEDKGDAIAISADTAASGQHSVKFVDRPDLQRYYNPHLVYTMQGDSGVARCRFAVRLEPGAELSHEWRDWSVSPYLTGPSLKMAGGRLTVRDKELLAYPERQWIRLELTTPLGPRAGGRWDLTVTLPGQPPRHFPSLEVGSPGWRKMTWLGFVSTAQAAVTWYLDDVEFTVQP